MRGPAAALLALVAAAPAPEKAARERPVLNHAYVVLDRETFDAIRTSAAAAALLGPGDAGLPAYAAPAADADRVFLRGRRTYLELFAPGNRFGEPVGKVGIGIGADTPAQFRRVEAGWRRACGTGLARETVRWTRTDPPVPWYESLSCGATASGDALVLWAMLYRPEFRRWQTGGHPHRADIGRAAVLAGRVAAGQGRFEVTGLTLDLDPALIARIVPQLGGAGMRRTVVPEGTRWLGDGWSLTLRPAVGRSRLRAIDLTRPAIGPRARPYTPVVLGNAVLAASGSRTLRLAF